METSEPSLEEPVVLGVQRCRQDLRAPRNVTEPCILCQEQQEVRWKQEKPGDACLIILSDPCNISVFHKTACCLNCYRRKFYNRTRLKIKIYFLFGFLAGQQRWSRGCHGFFCPAVDCYVSLPREDV